MKKPKTPLLAVFLISALMSAQITAKKGTPRDTSVSAYKLTRITVTGTRRYTPEQIIAFSGLHVGDNAGEGDFKEVVKKLGDSGMFSNVGYTYSFSNAESEVIFQLADNDKLVPARFDNFVWFADQELVAKIRSYLPLFTGDLPLGGELTDNVADALQAILVERGVPSAQVEVSRPGGEEGTIDEVVYSVSGFSLRIRNLEFPGARDPELSLLLNAAKTEQGDQYQRSKLRMFAQIQLALIYKKEGKLRAKFGEAQAKIVQEGPGEAIVDASLPVEEGPQYKLTHLEWSGNTRFPTAKLAQSIHLQPGQVIDAALLHEDLAAINLLYRTAGYMKANVDPQLEFNDAEGTASYKLEVKEGDQYHMGEVDIEGLDEKTRTRLRDAWTLREGEAYDASYARQFIKATGSLLPPGVEWGITIHEAVDDKDKSVDVSLRFAPKSS